MGDTVSFGIWLKRRRKMMGLTQDSLARLIGCSTVTIKKIESDDLQPSVQLAELIATQLAVPVGERTAFTGWARGGLASSSLLNEEQPWRLPTSPQMLNRKASSLPAQLTGVVGREHEVAAGRTLLIQPATRILTLSGPPGIGKTRLSIQIASEMQNDFADGVWFVPLSTVHDAELIASTIAQTLGVRELPEQSLTTTLQDFLRDKQLLIVLDNFEQIIRAATVVSDLLAAAPQVKALVTSREVLHLYGEQEFPVPPLALPDINHLPGIESVKLYPAIALFVERAQAVKPDFALTAENAPVIAEICARLDGLPLAIEMAAARVKWLSPRALLQRLSQRLAVLTGGPRDVAVRQQTLRGAIDWSFDLLDPFERRLFAGFAVFANSAATDAAQVVLDFDLKLRTDHTPTAQSSLRKAEIQAGLRSLTDKSLLRIVVTERSSDEPRFAMLGTIREYALEKLNAGRDGGGVRERHLAYYTVWASQAEARLHGPDQVQWLDSFELEHDNLRSALHWALDSDQYGLRTGLQLAASLGWFWRMRGHLSEGLQQLQAFLQRPETAGAGALRAKALSAAGLLAYYQADYALAQTLYEESLDISRVLGDKSNRAFALHGLGNVCWYQGNQARATALHEESVACYRQIGDRWGVALALAGLAGVLGYQGDFTTSRAMFEESLAISADLGDKWAAAFSLWSLGDVSYAQGDYHGARTFFEQSLPIARDLGDKLNVAFVLAKLASLAMQQGDYDRLGELAQEALALFREMGDRWQPPFLLRMQGYVALHQGLVELATILCKQSLRLNIELGDDRGAIAGVVALAGVAVARGSETYLRHAAQLFGAADGLLTAREMQLLPPDERAYVLYTTRLRSKIDANEYDSARAVGVTMSLAQTTALALGYTDPVAYSIRQ